MNIPKITVVAGLAGSGKTTWITQQIDCSVNATSNILYFSPGTGNVPIDQTRIKSEHPTVKEKSLKKNPSLIFFRLIQNLSWWGQRPVGRCQGWDFFSWKVPKVFGDGQEVEFLNQLPTADAVYIELGFYLELNAVTPILNNLSYRAIAPWAAP
jgi:hypothetical protein